jgi:hypothetical protein
VRRARILRKGLTEAEALAAADLAAEAGFATEEIEVVTAIGEPAPGCDDEILLVVMTSALCLDPSLEDEFKKLPLGGRRAICIWPSGGEAPSEPPSAAGNYAYSIIPWNVEKLRAVAADDDVMFFETSSGAPLPKVKMEHNLCVDEETVS